MSEKISVLIPEEEIRKRIAEVGAQLSRDYEGEEVLMICILRGGVFFACELAKHLTVPVSMDFMCVSSYGSGTVSSGRVKIIKDLDENIEGKHVLIAEDIVDSGNTLSTLIKILQVRKPASIRLCTLLDKPERRVVDIKATRQAQKELSHADTAGTRRQKVAALVQKHEDGKHQQAPKDR